ncbi:hypothetical protein [Paenibacillus macquariensis]|nr:hypothetical protein [Paenibacillus macquariensis]
MTLRLSYKSFSHGLERANVYGALATQFQGDWAGLPKVAYRT